MAASPELLVHSTPESLAEAASGLLVHELRASLGARGRFFLMLSGGTTPKAMYRSILERNRVDADAFRMTDYFMGDERAVPWDNPQSNAGEAARLFLDPLEVAQGRRHFANGGAPNLDREAEQTTALTRRIVPAGEGGIPVIDLVLLGMGTDGHTASLFPGTVALDDKQARYVRNEVPQLQTTRITATYPLLNAARHVLILATGENKADLMAEILAPGAALKYPVQRVAPQRLTWMLDSAAASKLPK